MPQLGLLKTLSRGFKRRRDFVKRRRDFVKYEVFIFSSAHRPAKIANVALIANNVNRVLEISIPTHQTPTRIAKKKSKGTRRGRPKGHASHLECTLNSPVNSLNKWSSIMFTKLPYGLSILVLC